MTNDNDDRGNSSNGPTEHYQPWLRNQEPAPRPGVPGAVSRPRPLPTTPAAPVASQTHEGAKRFESHATQDRQRPAAMTADELLAKPVPLPSTGTPAEGVAEQVGAVGKRIGGVLGAFADWTIELGRKADVPERIARLELGRRARAAGAATVRLLGRGAAGAGQAATAAIKAAGRASEAAAPRLKAAASAAKDGIAKGASAAGAGLGGAARKVADVTPLPTIASIGGKAEPAVESQLEKLLEQEAVATRPGKPVPALPLFAEPIDEQTPTAGAGIADEAVSPAAAVPPTATKSARPAAPGPQVTSSNPAGTPYASTPTAATGSSPAAGGRGSGGPAAPGSLTEWARHPASWVLGGLALVGMGFGAGAMWGGSGLNRDATERTIHDYLLNNPEIIPQAMEKLQTDRQAAAVNRLRERIERPFSGAWAGAADGDVVLTVFTDYACTFCRASVPDIDRLLREDRRLKVVFRELPILSRDSEPAARLALAAARRGRYMAMHRALFESGNPDSAARVAAAEALEVPADNAQLNDAAITRELESNITLARELGFDGTPSWVVGNRLLTGAVGYDQLRAAVAAARGE